MYVPGPLVHAFQDSHLIPATPHATQRRKKNKVLFRLAQRQFLAGGVELLQSEK